MRLIDLGSWSLGMVAAQAKNASAALPIYGCYVSGRNWFFVLLEATTYCLSDAYVATSKDVYDIFAILKKCKFLVDINARMS
jgi:hypothetical protein